MKYLFFDLECSNCYGGVGKVCEFGAVITDEHFNILKEISIPMSPGKKQLPDRERDIKTTESVETPDTGTQKKDAKRHPFFLSTTLNYSSAASPV